MLSLSSLALACSLSCPSFNSTFIHRSVADYAHSFSSDTLVHICIVTHLEAELCDCSSDTLYCLLASPLPRPNVNPLHISHIMLNVSMKNGKTIYNHLISCNVFGLISRSTKFFNVSFLELLWPHVPLLKETDLVLMFICISHRFGLKLLVISLLVISLLVISPPKLSGWGKSCVVKVLNSKCKSNSPFFYG